MFEKYYYIKSCPICEKELLKPMTNVTWWKALCDNGCFKIEYYFKVYDLGFFNTEVDFHMAEEEKYYEYYRLNVKYWKENDRYIAEILSRK